MKQLVKVVEILPQRLMRKAEIFPQKHTPPDENPSNLSKMAWQKCYLFINRMIFCLLIIN